MRKAGARLCSVEALGRLVVSGCQESVLGERSRVHEGNQEQGELAGLNSGLCEQTSPASWNLSYPLSHFLGIVGSLLFLGMERGWDGVSYAGMCILGVLSVLSSALNGVWGFNFYAEHPTVYRGPDGSYFGYAVDFYQATADSNT